MIRSVVRRFRRGIAMRLYAPKIRDRSNKLSVSGVFDFAFDNPTKREIVEFIGTSSTGLRKRYNEDEFATISSISHNSVYRPKYMDEYVSQSDNDFVQETEALKRYIASEAIPELVECKVIEAVVSDDEDEITVVEVEELLELDVIEAYRSQYKSSGVFVPNEESDMTVVGARPGERFEFAYDALRNVHLTDKSFEFAESRI
jgi:hypothetical protein